jgi:hypothetical protein
LQNVITSGVAPRVHTEGLIFLSTPEDGKFRFGSLADIGERIRDVRFTLNSGPAATLLKESASCQKRTFKLATADVGFVPQVEASAR